MNKNTDRDDNGFLFNVDILIKSPSNALALQKLFEILNSNEQVIDFRVKSGMELGEIIDNLIQAKKQSVISKASKPKTAGAPSPAKKDSAPKPLPDAVPEHQEAAKKAEADSAGLSSENDPYEWIKVYSKDNRLVRLTTNRQGKKISLPCRILNYDDSNQMVNVYHVDEKQVYTFNINEIDEFSAG